MNKTTTLVFLVACVALVAMLASSASALADITCVTVNGVVDCLPGSTNVAVFAGETIPVRVTFVSDTNASDVRVVVRLLGQSGFSAVSERFAILPGRQYSQLLSVRLPFDIDPSEEFDLEVSVESRHDSSAPFRIPLQIQRESYLVEIQSVDAPDQARAGALYPLDIVLKNRGFETAEDNYVRVSIPELGASKVVYFGDLTPEDQNEPAEKEDANERRVFLSIPASAPAGVYTVQIQTYNSDSSTTATKRVVVLDASEDSRILSASTTKRFGVGEQQTYTLTLVNTGATIQVYELSVDAPQDLSVELEDSIVPVAAGSSRTVEVTAMSSQEGTYNFAVDVTSDDALIKRENFVATVEGNGSRALGVNASVLLTVVLAIIFVVLVVVLIVLLTRKPQKSENFGESYY